MKVKVNLIKSLFEYLEDYPKCGLYLLTPRLRLFVMDKAFPNRGWEYDGSHLKLSPGGEDSDGNYRLQYDIWYVSHHNGNPYNNRTHYAILTQELADLIIKDLENQYIEKETKRLVAARQKEMEDQCRDKVVPAMQRFRERI